MYLAPLSGYREVKKTMINLMLSRFHRIPERDGRTDRQADKIATAVSRVSMLTCDKN